MTFPRPILAHPLHDPNIDDPLTFSLSFLCSFSPVVTPLTPLQNLHGCLRGPSPRIFRKNTSSRQSEMKTVHAAFQNILPHPFESELDGPIVHNFPFSSVYKIGSPPFFQIPTGARPYFKLLPFGVSHRHPIPHRPLYSPPFPPLDFCLRLRGALISVFYPFLLSLFFVEFLNKA